MKVVIIKIVLIVSKCDSVSTIFICSNISGNHNSVICVSLTLGGSGVKNLLAMQEQQEMRVQCLG